jgi:hypothetical protein
VSICLGDGVALESSLFAGAVPGFLESGVIERMRRRTPHIAVQRCRSMGGFLPLLVGSVLIALLATAAGPTSSGWLFQSPVSPIVPSPSESPSAPQATVTGPAPGESPAAPQATVTGPALVSVPAVPNFLPWVIGLLAVVGVVLVAMWWRGRKKEGGASE